MMFATSADGTRIAYDRSGGGPPLVLVVGAFCTRMTTKDLSALLAAHFTVYEYDRRGRGDSGDTKPYAPGREFDDLAAVIDTAGGRAAVFGHSSGAVIALEAAARGVPITAVVAYEPPYLAGGDPQTARAARERISAAIDEDRRRDAIAIFLMECVGVPQEQVATLEHWPDYPGMLAVAHTLPYDMAVSNDATLPIERLRTIEVPVLMLDGSMSAPAFAEASRCLAAELPRAERRVLDGEGHGAPPQVVAPIIEQFLQQAG